jgi:hypothetical protein
MLLSAACEVLVHTCGSVCELTELASEGGEEKGKEENENSKEVFAWRQLLESHTALAEDLGHRHMTQFIVNSEFNEISIALPELPPEL